MDVYLYGMSPTERTLKALRADGWLCEVVEKWIPRAKVRKDLWGWCDIVGIRGSETLGVQCTTASNMAARVKKILASEHLPHVLNAGWRVEVWGWRRKEGVWSPRIEVLRGKLERLEAV